MIDFSTLKGLTIPEGNVSKIEDAQGNVLWSAKPSVATLTITANKGSNTDIEGDSTYININADVCPMPNYPQYVVNPFKVTCKSSASHTITVPVGTIINCKVCTKNPNYPEITLNGTKVSASTYDYVVTGDANFDLRARYSGYEYGIIQITET